MNKYWVVLSLICCVGLVSNVAAIEDDSAQTLKIPVTAKSRTQAFFDNKNYQFLMRNTTDSILKQKNLRQRKQVKAFFELLCRYLKRQDCQKQRNELLKRGTALYKAGIKDPLFVGWYGVVLFINRKYAEALPLLQANWYRVKESHYAAINKYYISRAIACCMFNLKKGNFEKWQQIAYDYLAAAIEHNEFRDDEIHVAYKRINYSNLKKVGDIEQWQNIHHRLKGKEINPWLREMIEGKLAVNLAWKARGNGWASTVSKEGWQGFGNHLDRACRHFMKAWELRPDLPHAAGDMLTVSMGGHAKDGESLLLWFQRAVQAQFDYKWAYRRTIWALRPRWGGSHQDILAFGEACYATRRFDTVVPVFYIYAMLAIAQETNADNWKAVFNRPGVSEKLDHLFRERLKHVEPDSDGFWAIKAEQAICKMLCNEYEESWQIYKTLPEKLSFKKAFPDWGKVSQIVQNRQKIENTLKLYTGKHRQDFQQVDQLLAQGQKTAALRLLKKLAEAYQQDQGLYRHILTRLGMIAMGQAYEDAQDDLSIIHVAARRGFPRRLKMLIDAGFDVNSRNYKKWVPLHYAICHNNRDCVEVLLANGADINARSNVGCSPLVFALENRHYDMALYLIERGVDVNLATAKHNWAPLHYAAWHGKLNVIKALIEKGADLNKQTIEGYTPIHVAVYHKHPEIVNYLLQKGVNVNTWHYRSKRTPLHKAIYNKMGDIAKELINHGASLNAKTKSGISPVGLAISKKDKKLVQFMLTKEFNVNQYYQNDWPLIHLAAYYFGDHELIKAFIEKGADITRKTKRDGASLISIASQRKLKKTVAYLKSKGETLKTGKAKK